MTDFTKATFEEAIAGPKPVMVDFWATWCMPCTMLSPLIADLANRYEGKVVSGKVNTDEEMELSLQYGITAIPTVLFFQNGREVQRIVGVNSPDAYVQVLDSLL